MPEKTYLFYDIESTGLNKAFDQVLQFAAIRTDLALNEISRHEITIKLSNDVIPSPGAIITHGIGIAESQKGLPEDEGILQIHTLMNTPNTISVGYNTLGFDDEFLRFSFYKHLLPPYTHQFQSGCARMDIYPMAAVYYLYHNELLQWPQKDGRASLKLEALSQLNALARGPAHDAMVDVEATLALAKHFYQHKDMWDYLCGCFDKNTELARLAKLDTAFQSGGHHPSRALIVLGKLGARANFISPVLSLGQHAIYKNQSIWLRLDTVDLSTLTTDTIITESHVIRKKPAEQEIILPYKERFLAVIDQECLDLAQMNTHYLEANPGILTALCEHHTHYTYPDVDNIDPNAALYTQGFPSRTDEQQYRQFVNAAPRDKVTQYQQLQNPARKENALRILGRHYYSELPVDLQAQYNEYLDCIYHDTQPIIDYKNNRKLTILAALQQIEHIQKAQTLTQKQQDSLQALSDYLQQLQLSTKHTV